MHTTTRIGTTRYRGFSLLEVLIGVLIFVVGMLALASLQGNLTRSASDANVRTVAANIAEEIIETARGFARVTTDPDGVYPAYADIVSGSRRITRGGIQYNVVSAVTDYYYDLVSNGFTTTNPGSVAVSDYKLLVITVSWTAPEFRTEEGQTTTGALGSGSVTVSETIGSLTTRAASKVTTQSGNPPVAPPVDYNPGARPDIVSISLGNNKFKESTLPEPDVIRREELVETRFDVITYSHVGADAVFLRREEFISVSCECTLKAPPEDAESAGRRPTVWAGDEYAEGHLVNKAYGVSALMGGQQSPFCDICCRDHHDGGSSADDHPDTAVNRYNPFRAADDYHAAGTFAGDHKHYSRTQRGALVLADAAESNYFEACKLVRKNGFFRVAQDFRQEDLHVFPADFLDDQGEVDTYSAYVTTAAQAFETAAANGDYEIAPPCIGGPFPCVGQPTMGGDYPATLEPGEFPSWSTLPLGGSDTQQLRSRGLYLDYLSEDLRDVIDCLAVHDDRELCKSGDVELDKAISTNILEIIPFYDVQMTWLDRWNETPNNTPVDTTNEGLEDRNAHSRGVASRDVLGCSDVEATGHLGNLAFTDTAAIDPHYSAELTRSFLDVQSVGYAGLSPCAPVAGIERTISGRISETVPGLTATDIEVVGLNGALCDRTPGGYECIVLEGSSNPRVEFNGYGKSGTERWACMVGAETLTAQGGVDRSTSGENQFQRFLLTYPVDPQPEGTGYDLNVQPASCLLL